MPIDYKVSILICSYAGSKYRDRCVSSILSTTEPLHVEILIDAEKERTGLVNTPSRYQRLFEKTDRRTEYIVKSDDDVEYFPGWLEACIKVLNENPKIGYVSPLNHHLLFGLGRRDLHVDSPLHAEKETVEPVPFCSGACWVFRRWLWQVVPYGNLNGVKTLDSNYGAAVRKAGYQPAYLSSVLCSHLGTDRHGGIEV